MIEQWPDGRLAYDYPARTDANRARWQGAVEAGLAGESLTLAARDDEGDVFQLSGHCPRCGHQMTADIEFDVILGAFPPPARASVFTIRCDCQKDHAGRDPEHKGCGWGGWIPVRLTAPQ